MALSQSPPRATLRPDGNVIAVHCEESSDGFYGRFIDVGMTALRPAAPIPVKADDAQQAAWMVVSNVVMNLDETLTKR